MSDQFNPTKKDLLLLDEKLIQLKADKRKLIDQKVSAERTLSVLQAQYLGLAYNSPEFLETKSKRNAVKQEYFKIEHEIRKINEEIAYKSGLRNEVQFHLGGKKCDILINDKAIARLIGMQEKYNAFSKDRTRISSLRVMAAEVRDELDKIIKHL